MSLFSLEKAAVWIPGATIFGDPRTQCDQISIDSRCVEPGDLFVALKGERFDAHCFLKQVSDRQAPAVLVSKLPEDQNLPGLLVPDTHQALILLAKNWRKRFPLPLVAVVGSNGKTTVKDMIASIFAKTVGVSRRLATLGNANNFIGVPLTLLCLRAIHRLAVVEMGINHPGETAELADIVSPTIAVVNNAQREHQEFMINVQTVAKEHAAVIDVLPSEGRAVFSANDTYTPLWKEAAGSRAVFDFSLMDNISKAVSQKAMISGYLKDPQHLEIHTPMGSIELKLPMTGFHNAHNALAAAAAALAAEIDLNGIQQGLETSTLPEGRLTIKKVHLAELMGATLIDDSYNANPDSVRAAIDVLASYPAPRVLILGDMGEIGRHSPDFHYEVGAYARAQGIDRLYGLGLASTQICEGFGVSAVHFMQMDALLEHFISSDISCTATILVKGSRFMRMENIVAALTQSTALSFH